MSADVSVYIVGESEILLWGINGRTRLERMLRTIKSVTLIDRLSQLTVDERVLLLRADGLYGAQVLTALLALDTQTVLTDAAGRPLAILTDGQTAETAREVLCERQSIPEFFAHLTVQVLPVQIQSKLRKKYLPYAVLVQSDNQDVLEKELFMTAYKSVTDLITKWLWPWPAFMVTRFCVKHGIKPNQVTFLSLLLTILAGLAFWHSAFGIGLVLAWLMTFLDTVDGKLARVTLTSSKFGDVLDHGLDLIHPPLWYLAWGVGLMATSTPLPGFELLMGLMFMGYVGGRLLEWTFRFGLGGCFSIYIWRKVDSFHRLITARRNPSLIFLTAGWIVDRSDIGLILVIVWHILSSLFIGYRLLVARRVWLQEGALCSWFEAIDPIRDRDQLAVRVFTRLPRFSYSTHSYADFETTANSRKSDDAKYEKKRFS